MRCMILGLILCATAIAGDTGKPAGADDGTPDYVPVVYNKQERTQDWFQRMHRKFKSQIGKCDGKFYDLTVTTDDLPLLWKGPEGRKLGDVSYIMWEQPLPIKWQYLDNHIRHTFFRFAVGEVREGGVIVLDVQRWYQKWEEKKIKGHRRMRRTKPRKMDGVQCILKGLNTSTLKAGQPIAAKKPILVVCTGMNEFTAVDTSPLTKEEFRKALESGFKLMGRKRVCVNGKWSVKRVPIE